jgi:hypothetical protein
MSTWSNSSYEGEWKDGWYHGKGIKKIKLK